TGKFELAHRGSLFLDEIGELSQALQVKLLRVLEERQIMRVGGSELIDVDFRLIAATHRSLEEMVEAGDFREDLYYRLKVVTLEIPPLRGRQGDVRLLADHYLHELAEEHGKGDIVLSQGALRALETYPWPGNVRQLRNVLEQVVIFHAGGEVEADQLPDELRQATLVSGGEAPIQARHGRPRTMDEIERRAILETLERTSGHRADAAKMLGIGLRTLQRKLKDYKDQGFVDD
ncbi:MAG: sigma 54-interacting transcriptional regulator, partial [Acidobacteriota bacterium]